MLRAELQSARMSKITKMTAYNLAWHRMLYSCIADVTHMTTVGLKGLMWAQKLSVASLI